MTLLFCVFFLHASVSLSGFNLTQTKEELLNELFRQSFEFNQDIYPWLFTIAPSADTNLNVHQLQRIKSAMYAITESIESCTISTDQIQQMFLTQPASKVISRIASMMGSDIDVSDLLIDDRFGIIPHHMVVHYFCFLIPAFDKFIQFWEETSDFIKDTLLKSFKDGGYAQLTQVQNTFLLAAKCKFPYAMIQDYLFEIASQQKDVEAMKALDDRIHSCSNVEKLQFLSLDGTNLCVCC